MSDSALPSAVTPGGAVAEAPSAAWPAPAGTRSVEDSAESSASSSPRRARWAFALSALALAGVLAALAGLAPGLPPLGALLDPAHGVYATARAAAAAPDPVLVLDGLDAPVTVVTDARAVPHIFAASDRDAIRTLGYLVARDRLFQMDFVSRVAAGRLAELLGPAAAETDAFLRTTGMKEGAERNLARIERENGIERDLLAWYAEGANAYIDALAPAQVPLEYRLTGTRPERWAPVKTLLLQQYMAYDLSFKTDDPQYTDLRRDLGAVYDTLYPRVQPYTVPIFPDLGGAAAPTAPATGSGDAARRLRSGQTALAGTLGEGFVHGKGSNNWAVGPARSASGGALLAGDMHLTVSLPAIWYEVHLSTPTMNVYGVTIPGTPLPVAAMNDRLAWTFTNTGSDQVDHYRLALDPTRRRYRFDGAWRDLTFTPTTIRVNGGDDVLDTLVTSHLGPVTMGDDGTAVALRWTAHEPSHTLRALYGMARATDYGAFERALRDWDTPMQNILVAATDGTIALRSTGVLPVRASGDGAGLRDGTTSREAWTGRVPFEQLPHSIRPASAWLASTNQMPAGAAYPHYLGHDWQATYRARRIAALLRDSTGLSVDSFRRFQGDVHAGQWDDLRPLLDTLTALPDRAAAVRDRLRTWNGVADTTSRLASSAWHLVAALRRLAFDERAFEVDGRPQPSDGQLFGLLRDAPNLSVWDRAATPVRERAADLLRAALAATADSLAGDSRSDTGVDAPWGRRHSILFRHLTRADALSALGRGPFPYGGFRETLAPGDRMTTTHAASWRVVVDMAGGTATGFGVYPGGQSGDPGSPHYDDFIAPYLAQRLFPLPRPARPDGLAGRRTTFAPPRAGR